jgi:legumain
MRTAIVVALCLVAAIGAVEAGNNWAVLVAGSNTYGNYRHQSDVCHAFQIVRKSGIPAERIIVMQYDDLANSGQNPQKGKIFNKPTPAGTAGVDVYAGCQKDYVGAQVTTANLINVLTGNALAMKGIGNGKVLQSGPNDNIFFFYSDHGTVGEVEMPVGGALLATKFNAAIQQMFNKKMYNKFVVYIESCESGSMFNNILPKNINVYATSASNPTESSWGCYCPPQDKVNGQSIGSCLGDLYSVNWMEDIDKFGTSRTLQDNFLATAQLTTMSKVMQWGDLSYTNLTFANFLSANTERLTPTPADPKLIAEAYSGAEGYTRDELRAMSAVSTYDIPMHLAYYEYLRSDKQDMEKHTALASTLLSELTMRVETDALFMKLSQKVAAEQWGHIFQSRAIEHNLECVAQAQRAFRNTCGEFNDYSRQYVRVLNNLCSTPGVSVSSIESALGQLCSVNITA